MEYTVDFLPDKNIVHIRVKGRLNFQLAQRYSKEAIKIARLNKCRCFILDHTETLLKDDVNKLHSSGEELQQFGFKNTDKIAIIVPQKSKNSIHYEALNENSRMSILKYFFSGDFSTANKWLNNPE